MKVHAPSLLMRPYMPPGLVCITPPHPTPPRSPYSEGTCCTCPNEGTVWDFVQTSKPVVIVCSHCHGHNCRSACTYSLIGPSHRQTEWLTQFQALQQQRSKQFQPLDSAPPLIRLHILLSLRSWLQYLNSALHKWQPRTLPSPPLMTASGILCIWNVLRHTELTPVMPTNVWTYRTTPMGDQGLFQSAAALTPLPPPSPWLLAPPCSRCGRPQPLNGSLSCQALIASCSQPQSCCWWTPPGQPLSAHHASLSTSTLGPTALPGVLPTTLLRRPSCAPKPPHTWEGIDMSGFVSAYSTDITVAAPSAPLEPLRILSINCGGLTSKLHLLLALLHSSDPDVVCLQEVGSAGAAASLNSLPYRVWHGEALPGGGLATLIHPRRIAPRTQPPHCQPGRHHLGLAIPLCDQFVLTIVNLHLPPRLTHVERRAACLTAVAFTAAARPGAQVLCGDLNEWPRPGGGGWLSKALSPSGLWDGFRSPYPAGEPTNHVPTARGTSSRELDWVLISAATPCIACTKVTLPGLCTHSALQVDLTIPPAKLTPLDPSGRQFRFSHATPEQLLAGAETISLYLYWAEAAGLQPDAAIRLCWDGLRSHIQPTTSRTHVRPEDAQLAAVELAAYEHPLTIFHAPLSE